MTPHVMISTYNCTINYASNVRFVLITVLQCVKFFKIIIFSDNLGVDGNGRMR